MAGPNPPRSQDERVLLWIRLRCDGHTVRDVAVRFGLSPTRIDTATQTVRNADMNESGEPPLAVAAHYWKARKRA